MEVTVKKPGMLTTVQDLGRRGHLHEGIPVGGAVDACALRIANLLVGNPEDAPGLEVTLTGPELVFSEATWVAVCGASFEGVPSWRPIPIEAGGVLSFGPRRDGCRAYLAVPGGFDADHVLGGSGTFLAGEFGGHGGRALRAGDVLRSANTQRRHSGHWTIDRRVLPAYAEEPTLRVVPGSHAGEFGEGLFESEFRVSAKSNRMGVRLEGAGLVRRGGEECLSSAVAPGTVQVPPDGHPIVLLADAQTLGGYPRVAHVATVDLPVLAQLPPGSRVRFSPATLAEAHALLREREHRMGLLRQGLKEKVGAPWNA